MADLNEQIDDKQTLIDNLDGKIDFKIDQDQDGKISEHEKKLAKILSSPSADDFTRDLTLIFTKI